MTVLVTGVRGSIGGRVHAKLLEAGHPVRGSSRKPGEADVQLDVNDPRGADNALDGVDAVFLYPTPGPQDEFLRAARERGVRKVVLLSTPEVYESRADNPIAVPHEAVERSLRDSGLPHTVVYPGWLATNASRDWGAQIRRTGRVALAHPEAQFTPTHPDDIAEVVVRLLTGDAYPGRMLAVTGPESLTQAQVVAILGEVLGREIAVDELTPQQALQRREPWMPESVMAHLLDVAKAAVGVPAPVNNTVERLTGHRPRTFRQWAEEHRADFAPTVPTPA